MSNKLSDTPAQIPDSIPEFPQPSHPFSGSIPPLSYEKFSAILSEINQSIIQNLDGPLRYRLTNAYLFVAVLQKDKEALASLIAALLHIPRIQILSVEIQNPITLGQTIDDKDCVLDLLVLLNGNIRINLEMQVANEGNWDDRSLYYLASKLVDLPVGADYTLLKPVIQIGILDFNYPKGNNEFYQEIFLMNRKTHKVFSDKARIHVLCLSQIENATPEDHASGLYQWAKLFKAATWKEMIDLSQNNPVMQNTVITIAQLSNEERIRQQCERREKYERDRINAMNYSYNQGHDVGYSEGHDSGYSEGHDAGYSEGRDAGYSEGHDSGYSEGRDAGYSEGHDSATQKFFLLNQKLIENNRSSEISKALSDPEYLEKLLAEFGIE